MDKKEIVLTEDDKRISEIASLILEQFKEDFEELAK